MGADMNQDEINERERNNPDNWSKPLGFYHSKLDSRVWVPQARPWMGSTLNLANPASRILVLLVILMLGVLLAAVLTFAMLHV
jgi:uncharacterized membrane protein